MRATLAHAQRPFAFLAGLLAVSLCLCDSPCALTLDIRTAGGDTTFYAPPGDTVKVIVMVDSEGEILTGVELFLHLDADLLQVLDALERPGLQPAETDSLLGNVLADTFLVVDDAALIHYAEADLVGRAASGSLFTFRVRVAGRYSGRSPIAVYQEPSAHLSSVYTLSSPEGRAYGIVDTTPLVFQDLPPRLVLPDSFEVAEDSSLNVDLVDQASDAETGAETLAWRVSGPDSLVSVTFGEGADSLRTVLTPVSDFAGPIPILFHAADPSGGEASKDVVLLVLPVNDAPRIREGALPDSVLLSEYLTVLPLLGAAVDVDDGPESLVWLADAPEPLEVEIGEGPKAQISAPAEWSGAETLQLQVEDPFGASASVSIRVVREAPLSSLPGDFDGDGNVGFTAYVLFAQNFGRKEGDTGYDARFDLVANGGIDFQDFVAFAKAFGE